MNFFGGYNYLGDGFAAPPNTFNTGGLPGATYSSTSATVPFDIPGGATIPALVSLVAFGVIRKLRHSTASKTCIAKPVTATVS